jgi:hypothetical protein
MGLVVRPRILLVVALVLFPGVVAAQSTISGLVSDTSGAVIPGVTVEASSPALIEKTRSVTTDAQGRFSIVDLRPGVYKVTFTLQGFSSISRDGIEVAANVTVPLNMSMRVGAVEETITVTGATPMVDVQQAAQRQVLGREQLDTLPTARSFLSTGVVVSTVKISRPDMGGIQVGQASYLSARGKGATDDSVEVDGLDVRISNGITQSGYNNFATVQDVTYQTSAISADSPGGGVRINMIPREGGNALNGDFYIGGSSGWQSNNLTPELIAAGLQTPDALEHLIEVTPTIGGPILKDKLWFFAAAKYNEVKIHPAGAHYFATGEPGYTTNDLHNLSGRVTWQVTPRNKITGYFDRWFKSQDHTIFFTPGDGFAPGVDWGTASSTYDPRKAYLGYVKWTSPVTNRLLLETGFANTVHDTSFGTPLPGIVKPFGTPEWYAGALKRDLVLNTFVGQANFSDQVALQPAYSLSGAVSYVTGSHTAKVGMQYRYGISDTTAPGANAHLTQQFRNGTPDSVLVYALPYRVPEHIHEVALYGMDSWVIRRLTLNLGARFDRFTGGVDPSSAAAGRFVPTRSFGAVNPIDPFLGVSPRLSAVYDLFGNARTALKFSASKYLTQLNTSFFNPFAPTSSAPDTRIWLDTDLTPGTATASGRSLPTNADGIAQDNEIGPSGNNRFGLAPERRAADDLSREYSWDYSVSVQHEIMPRLSATAGWYYTRTYNAMQAVNRLRSRSDYTTFQASNPYNTSETLTIFRLDPGKVGTVDTVTTNSDVNHRDYQAIEASVMSRLIRGGTINFGWAMERVRTVTCDTPDPNQLRFCDQTGQLYQELGAVSKIPFRHELKLFVAQSLPYQFNLGVSVVSFAGNALYDLPRSLTALGISWAVPANIFPGGRTEVVTLPLVSPGELYLKRWSQLDVSLKRRFRVGLFEFQPALELYNLTNSSVVLSQNQNFGPSLGRPLTTLQGRLTKLALLMKF